MKDAQLEMFDAGEKQSQSRKWSVVSSSIRFLLLPEIWDIFQGNVLWSSIHSMSSEGRMEVNANKMQNRAIKAHLAMVTNKTWNTFLPFMKNIF